MPEERGLYPKMKVLEQLSYLASLHGYSDGDAMKRAKRTLEDLGIVQYSHRAPDTLSLGNQQKVQIAAAMVHDPIALVLDEPFSGLDPTAVTGVLQTLRSRCSEGIPVLFSSHQLELVERLCDRVVILKSGCVVAQGTVEQLREDHGTNTFSIGFSQPYTVPERVLARYGATLDSVNDSSIQFLVPKKSDAYALLEDIRETLEHGQNTVFVESFGPVKLSLAEIFSDVVE